MERRKFLKIAGFGAASMLAIPGAGIASISAKEAIKGIIMNELHYLKLDNKGLDQFVEDFSTQWPLSTYTALKARSLYLMKTKAKDSYLVARFIREYLPSTDFFINKMDESKTVHYLGLYNPYIRPCANPFSSVYYPSEPAV